MSGSVNKVILIGNLGRDPEVRRMNSGDSVVSFSIATTESWKDKQSGERRDKTEWHNIVIFNENLGRVAEQYCKKGSKVYIEGSIQTRKWTDQSGVEKFSTEIVLQKFRGELTMLDGRGDGERESSGGGDYGGGYGGGSSGGGGGFGGGQRNQSSGPRESFSADLDDEIPF